MQPKTLQAGQFAQIILDVLHRHKVSTKNVSLPSIVTGTKNKTIVDDRIQILFAALGQTFNEKFTGRFPTPEIREAGKAYWQQHLSDLSDKQLAAGIEACFEWKENMAPNLNEFRHLCLEAANKPPSLQFYQALPRPLLNEKQIQHAEGHIAKMKAILKKGKSKHAA